MVDVSYSEAREQRFDFNQEVVVSSWSAVYVRRGERLNSLIDLDQKRVGVLADGIQLEYLTARVAAFNLQPQLVEISSYDVMLQQLQAKEIDVAVINRFTGDLAETQYPILRTDVVIAPSRDHFIAPQGQNAELLAAIDRHLKVLKANPDSAYYQAQKQWLETPDPFDRNDFAHLFIFIGLGWLGFGAIALLLWSRSIRQEMSRRQHIEEILLKREEQLRLALELSHIGTWDWRTGSDQVEWNDNHYRLLGYAPGTIDSSYQAWRERVHPDDLERVEAAVNLAFQAQTEFYQEYRIIRMDGSIRWVSGQGHGLLDQQGRTVRMLGVMLDITERKEAEEALRKSEATKQQILQAIPDLLLWMKADGTCIGVAGGSNVNNILPPSQAVGNNQYNILSPQIAEQRRHAVNTVLRTGKMYVYEQQIPLAEQVLYEEVRVVPVEEDQVLVIIRNITDRKQAELALAESEQRYRMVTEGMSDLVCLHGLNGQYLYVTPSAETLMGYTQSELIGELPYKLVHPDDTAKVREAFANALAGNVELVTYRIQRKSNHYIWLETLAKPITDELGRVLHLQTTSRDVSDRIRVEEQLRRDAVRDALTGLPNRILLVDRLELALKRIKRYPNFQFAVLFLDFDRFKVINDSLGHFIGDQLLSQLAQTLSELVRETDLVARLGGDEFVILLESITSLNDAVNLAERIADVLRSPLLIQGHKIFITASIGIVAGSSNYQQADNLIRNADIAMYRAKANGRANFAIFDPEMHAQALQRLQLENDLRKALEHQQLTLYYQPIISLKTLKLAGFEALLRWQHPHLGTIPPDQFIGVAEESGLIIPIGQWVLQTACEQLAQWQQLTPNGSSIRLTVNLSVKQLTDTVLIPQLENVICSTGVAVHNLGLEITESLLVKDFEATSKLLNQIQEKGIKISIDDFGTGYSSLSYLHQLPVDALKIDRAFISPSGQTAKNQTIAESIIALSNLLELNAIAEGVETVEQLRWLQALNCEFGQGYLFSQPVQAQDAEKFIREGINTYSLQA